MAGETTPPTTPPPNQDDAKKALKDLVKESMTEWADEREKTRTETAKPKNLLEGLLGF